MRYPSVTLSKHESSLQWESICALQSRHNALMNDAEEADSVDLPCGGLAIADVVPRAHSNECGDNPYDEHVHQNCIPTTEAFLFVHILLHVVAISLLQVYALTCKVRFERMKY